MIQRERERERDQKRRRERARGNRLLKWREIKSKWVAWKRVTKESEFTRY